MDQVRIVERWERQRRLRWAVVGLGLACLGTLLFPWTSTAQPSVVLFPASSGCAMAHCDSQMSDLTHMPVPAAPVQALWHDTTVQGSGAGLGCASNSQIAVCSLKPSGTYPASLRAYHADGTALWTSTLLDIHAPASAPMIDAAGDVIAADSTKLIRFQPDGSVAWTTSTPGGIPISPVTTGDSSIILATRGGPVSAYDVDTGTLLASLVITGTVQYQGVQYQGIFDTINTPAVHGNRIYIAAQFRDTARGIVLPYGRLYALDLSRTTTTGSLTIAWWYDFQGPSGGSPLLIQTPAGPTIYFDGRGVIPGGSRDPHLFAVVDQGTSGKLLWSDPMPTDPQASAAQDPRGGLWTFAPLYPTLVRLDQSSGAVLQHLNVDVLVNEPGVHIPDSAMSISGTATNPVMIVAATVLHTSSTFLIALDLVQGQLLWKYQIDQGKGSAGQSHGQFPVVLSSTQQPVVVFTTAANGIWAIGQ